MKIIDWENIYLSEVNWVIRMNRYRDINDSTCMSLLRELYALEKELFKRFHNKKTNNLTIRYREWFSLCHKYIRRCKKENNHIKADFLFSIWNHGNYCFPKHKDPSNVYDLCRDITEEELNYANTYLIPEVSDPIKKAYGPNISWYTKDSKVFMYRGKKFFIDNLWKEAHIYYKGQHRMFSTDWDWWFPIDQFLDLEMGWKKN